VPRRSLALLTAVLASALPAACGDEDTAQAPKRPPEATTPRTAPEPAPARTDSETPVQPAPAPAPATGEDPATAPLAPGEGDGTGRPPKTAPDGPDNDTPPPAGSPAESFERDCDASEACG
jgi:hypothetical protein